MTGKYELEVMLWSRRLFCASILQWSLWNLKNIELNRYLR